MTSSSLNNFAVTGSEAGLSGSEQIRIALEVIVDNNGVATTDQIVQGLESAIKSRNAN